MILELDKILGDIHHRKPRSVIIGDVLCPTDFPKNANFFNIDRDLLTDHLKHYKDFIYEKDIRLSKNIYSLTFRANNNNKQRLIKTDHLPKVGLRLEQPNNHHPIGRIVMHFPMESLPRPDFSQMYPIKPISIHIISVLENVLEITEKKSSYKNSLMQVS